MSQRNSESLCIFVPVAAAQKSKRLSGQLSGLWKKHGMGRASALQ
jgi:hypothetical protein